MTVDATDIALRDLQKDRRPRLLRGQLCDLQTFDGRIPMVEIEDNWVGLTTVDAGMTQQIFEEELAITFAMPLHAKPFVLDVGRLRPQVMLPAIRRMTRPAVALPLTRRERAEREVGIRLLEPAHAAAAHVALVVLAARRPRVPLERTFYHDRSLV